MPKVEERVVIASALDLQYQFDTILPALQLTETEDSWQKIEKSLVKLEIITKSGGYKYDNFPTLFKSIGQPIINSLLSERTKLSGTAADLLNSVAPRLGERFETLVHTFAPTLLLICARTNKVALFRAKKCLLLIAKHCKLPSLLPHLRDASRDKSQTMRIVSVEVALMLLEVIENNDRIGRRVSDLEVIVKGTATDRDPDVRQWCKRVFEVYVDRWPERASLFTSSFTPTTRRYLSLPKASGTSTATSIYTNAAESASPQKRAGPSEPSRQRHILLAPKPFSASTSTHPTATQASSLHATSLKPASSSAVPSSSRSQGRTQNMPSSGSGIGSSSSSKTVLIPATPTIKADVIDPQEEKHLTALRADLLKQATGTPSQGLAARLALQQFEFQLKKKSQMMQRDGEGESDQRIRRQEENADRALFKAAMSKKQSPPKKMPTRIIVAAPPQAPATATMVRKASNEINKPTQRTTSLQARETKAKKAAEEQEDVFRSRPIEKTVPTISKVASSISKGLSAREKLLGGSGSAVNKMKATSGRGNPIRKRTNLKVDIGKENIPPNSKLSDIAVNGAASEDSSSTAQLPVLQLTTMVTSVPRTEPMTIEEVPAAVESIDSAEKKQVSLQGGQDGEGAASSATPASSEVLLVPSLPEDVARDTATKESRPLDDWSKVVEVIEQDFPMSASKSSCSFHRNTGPAMSTPIRRPLGALQDNKILQSSPVVSLSKPVFVKDTMTTPLTLSRTPVQPPSVIASANAELARAKRLPLMLAASRKM